MTEEERRSPLFQELLNFTFRNEYNRQAFEGDEIVVKHWRYRLTKDGWVLVTKPSAESGDELIEKPKSEIYLQNLEIRNNTISPYMKQLNITLKEAKELWKEGIGKALTINDMLLKTWTQEELEEKEGYTWEESFELNSDHFWFIGLDGRVYDDGDCEINRHSDNKKYFKTKEQAESALAFAQLTHIVAKYNEKKWATTENGLTIHYMIAAYNNGDLEVVKTTYGAMVLPRQMFLFCDENDAKSCLDTNKELWSKYWMIKNG